jgi:hypothetical protein
MAFMRKASVVALALAAVSLGGCLGGRGGGGPHVFGGHSRASGASGGEIGVNSYLWRASLDTLAFMPLATADPYGGIINTDWYVSPEQPTERFKVTVYILDTRLRADGLNVTVFKQTKDLGGGWVDAPTSPQTETDIENSILTRARQLRLSNVR